MQSKNVTKVVNSNEYEIHTYDTSALKSGKGKIMNDTDWLKNAYDIFFLVE